MTNGVDGHLHPACGAVGGGSGGPNYGPIRPTHLQSGEAESVGELNGPKCQEVVTTHTDSV